LLAGCGAQEPTAPSASGVGVSVTTESNPIRTLPPDAPSVNAITAPVPNGSSHSDRGDARIRGASGGNLHVGHFRLIVPPGAWSGEAKVTITVPDRSRLDCQLEINPPTLNNFRVPVQLQASFGDCNVPRPDSVLVIWFDPAANRWKQVSTAGNVNSNARVVTTALSHFSRYAVVDGRAGW
jgi:hypothetical protein